jgi:hypothetical protein
MNIEKIVLDPQQIKVLEQLDRLRVFLAKKSKNYF